MPFSYPYRRAHLNRHRRSFGTPPALLSPLPLPLSLSLFLFPALLLALETTPWTPTTRSQRHSQAPAALRKLHLNRCAHGEGEARGEGTSDARWKGAPRASQPRSTATQTRSQPPHCRHPPFRGRLGTLPAPGGRLRARMRRRRRRRLVMSGESAEITRHAGRRRQKQQRRCASRTVVHEPDRLLCNARALAVGVHDARKLGGLLHLEHRLGAARVLQPAGERERGCGARWRAHRERGTRAVADARARAALLVAVMRALAMMQPPRKSSAATHFKEKPSAAIFGFTSPADIFAKRANRRRLIKHTRVSRALLRKTRVTATWSPPRRLRANGTRCRCSSSTLLAANLRRPRARAVT